MNAKTTTDTKTEESLFGIIDIGPSKFLLGSYHIDFPIIVATSLGPDPGGRAP